MKELGKWQVISFVSRMVAMGIGIVQGFVIAAVLSKSEWGIVQLAISIGGALGIYQNLGLASASTREISSSENDEDIFKIFFTSVFVRYCITVPIAFGLIFFAKNISLDVYKNSALILPLRIYGATLLIQGMQSILNSVIMGTKRFKQLFLYQAAIAVVSISLYLPLVYLYRINGYFYAFILFNLASSFSLAVIAFKPLKGKISLPNKKEFLVFFKQLFSISLAIYLMKIIYTNWEKFGNNSLGLFNSPEIVATFAFALLYSKKLMSISDSATDVSLPVLSEKYTRNFDEYKELFTKNFNKLFSFIVLVGTFAAYWAPFIVRMIVGSKYDDSFILIPPMILAYIIYSFINIINASVLIPAKMTWDMIISYVLLFVGTVCSFFLTKNSLGMLNAMSWAMATGSILSVIYMLLSIKRKLNFEFFNIDHIAVLIASLFISLMCPMDILWLKASGFLIFLPLMVWSLIISKFISIEDVKFVFEKAKSLPSKIKK